MIAIMIFFFDHEIIDCNEVFRFLFRYADLCGNSRQVYILLFEASINESRFFIRSPVFLALYMILSQQSKYEFFINVRRQKRTPNIVPQKRIVPSKVVVRSKSAIPF
ncbi:hypothetical protein BK022_21710 [Methylorubrum extorquens]|uniref:Uncharacterized protein n=1 Tax=Methylorubrum extorquens TaxID=408 RepID=A0A1S1P1T0_METEX|nr:hypothetical protein BK022_21710 [Methylorubrum extorquens]